MYIEKINRPTDVKNLNSEQLHILADEMRQALLQKLSKHGGHFGPNLGMVEAAIALHYVFNSPTDKIEAGSFSCLRNFPLQFCDSIIAIIIIFCL